MNLYLIDGNSYVYRAFYAIKGLTNSKGFPTNAIYGFTNMLLKILREKKPDGILVSFDSPVPTERHRIFEAYKAQRPETPGDLVQQLPHIRRMIRAFNINIYEVPGYEADDLLSTIAVKAAEREADVFIVTSDKDMLQIVDDRIRVYDPVKDRVLDREYVIGKFGVGPERVAEFMALTGDAVDNIPGIKGIGEKTARELLLEVKDIEELLNHPEKIKKEKLRSLVMENAEMVRLSKRLATIDVATPIEVDVKEFGIKEPNWSELLSLFREFEFGSMLKLIPSAKSERQYETILTIGQLKGLLSSLKGSFAFDIEATGRDALKDNIIGLAISHEKGKACYIPLGHSYENAPAQPDKGDALALTAGIFEAPEIPKIGHNLRYDIEMLRREGIDVRGQLYDTMLASYLINPNRPGHGLGEVSFEYLSYRKKTFQEVVGKRKKFSEVPLEDATAYAAEDAALSFELKELLFEKLKQERLDKLYFDIEMPLIGVLIEMEEAGFKVDVDRLNDMSRELSREIDSIQKRIYFLAGEEFNINSPKQLSRVLFLTLGLKPGKKTKTGYSTELSVLEELAGTHDLPGEILNYRSLSKLKSTYTDVLPELINPDTGRIHTSFNQTVTATGRLSSSDPNLQNIPIRGEWGRRIRQTFIAEPGCLILSADYSQIELRILAHLSEDEGLIDAFSSGVDIHTRTASEIFGVAPDKVTSEMRRVAKTVNFGVIYGISPYGLSEALNISRDNAKTYIDGYFARHEGVKSYIERTLKDAGGKGYVVTMFGRKRSVPELKSRNATTRSLGERLAINSPIQGTAADIIKIAMINLSKGLKEKELRTRMILQVHDELVFELPGEELDTVMKTVKEMMESAASLSVPLKVEIGYGRNWAEAHD
ncbi:MAG TPA: DNA polymerase I [Thermodesulfovibrionales bacterium]|nr:DNA polymerase I [Thermodesulfovibrionales bacterium]